MLTSISNEQSIYLNSQSEEKRKNSGQFFTDETIAEYMASLISPFDQMEVKILDAGAGAGILSISAVLQCLQMNKKDFYIELYEIDSDVCRLIYKNMTFLKDEVEAIGGSLSFKIKNKDFVISRPDKNSEKFDLALINPPYFKYNSKTSLYANITTDLFKGNPNIYASFMAIVSSCLAPNGQMITITPRSFTNGLYFKGFRNYLNSNCNLKTIHIFKKRNKVFKNISVLQENIICSFNKEKQQNSIEIRTSEGNEDVFNFEYSYYAKNLIINKTDSQNIILIPETKKEGEILNIVSQWPSDFVKNDYFISTGPVVEHRTRNFITNPKDSKNSIPLMRMHNIKNFKSVWTGEHKKDARFLKTKGYKKHIISNNNYMLIKRFTAKDEKKRLSAGIYEKSYLKDENIALENHLNYVGKLNDELSIKELYGLTALFNSSFMDGYFRCISGNTQVNATEVRLMKLPSVEKIVKIGNQINSYDNISQEHLDNIVNNILDISL